MYGERLQKVRNFAVINRRPLGFASIVSEVDIGEAKKLSFHPTPRHGRRVLLTETRGGTTGQCSLLKSSKHVSRVIAR